MIEPMNLNSCNKSVYVNIIMLPFKGFCWKPTEETTMQYPLGYGIEDLVQLLSLHASISQTKENYKNLEATQFLSNKKTDLTFYTLHHSQCMLWNVLGWIIYTRSCNSITQNEIISAAEYEMIRTMVLCS